MSNQQNDKNANFLNPLFDKEKREAMLQKKEYERNLKSKEEILEKEFEKQLLQDNLEEVNTQENLLKLRGLLDSITGSNDKKFKELVQIHEQSENLEDQQKRANRSPNLRMGNPNEMRLAPSVIAANPYSIHEAREREVQMKKQQQHLEQLQEKEEQIQITLENKLDIIYNDNIVLKERIYELQRTLNHAEDRYKDLVPATLTAKNLEVLTLQNLKETSKRAQEIQDKDEYLKKVINEYHHEETEKLVESKTKMSDVLVKIDQYRKLKEQQGKQIEELENYHIKLQEQKTNAKHLNRVIDVLEQLEKDYISSKRPVNFDNEDQSEEIPHDPLETESTQSSNLKNAENSMGDVQSLLLDKSHFLHKIYEFSLKRNNGGVSQLADKLVEIHQNMAQKEISVKRQYEEFSREKGKKSSELAVLKSNLQRLQVKNDDAVLDKEMNSMITQVNRKSTFGTGFLPVREAISTVNQVSAGGLHKIDVSILLDQTEEKQTTAIHIYSGFIEMLLKFASLISKIEAQNFYSISEELKDIVKDINTFVQTIQEIKKPETLNSIAEIQLENKEACKIQSLLDLDSNTEKINPERVTSIFLKYFEGFQNQAAHFNTILQNDQFIKNFVTPQMVNDYLCQHSESCLSKEGGVEEALEDTIDLVREGSKTLLERVEALTGKYIDFIQEISYNYQGYQEELESRLKTAGKGNLDALDKPKADTMTERLQNTQEIVALKHCKRNEIEHPKRNLAEEEAQLLAQENLDLKNDSNEELHEHDDEVVRGKLKGLAHNILEKKRGNFYRINKIQYPHKTKRQLAQEFHAQEYIIKKKVEENLTADQREENYFQSEQETIKQKQTEFMASLNSDKDHPVIRKELPNYATQRPSDKQIVQAKKKMLENSQYLSKIHFIETQINSDKYNQFRRSNYGSNTFASLDKSSTIETILNKNPVLKKKAKSTKKLDCDDEPLDFKQPKMQHSSTPTPSKKFVLPQVQLQTHRPTTSVAESKKSSRQEQTKSVDPSFMNKSSFLKESAAKSTNNIDSIFRNTEVVIDKILAKANKKNGQKRLSSKNTVSTGFNSSNTTISGKTRGLFREYDSMLDDVSCPMIFATPFTPRSERNSYNYDSFRVNTSSILVENQRF